MKVCILIAIFVTGPALADQQITCYLTSKKQTEAKINTANNYSPAPASPPPGSEFILATRSIPIADLSPPAKFNLDAGENHGRVSFYSMDKGTTNGKKTLKQGFTHLDMSLEVENFSDAVTTEKNIFAGKVGFNETVSFQGISLHCSNQKPKVNKNP